VVGIGGDRYILREATDYDALGNGAHDHPFWPFGGGGVGCQARECMRSLHHGRSYPKEAETTFELSVSSAQGGVLCR